MTDNAITFEEVNTAFTKLKRFIYFDKGDLLLRLRVSKFLNSKKFKIYIEEIVGVVNSNNFSESEIFQGWLSEIKPRVVPKRVGINEIYSNSSINFITNKTTQKKYNIDTVNYFFSGPVQLYIIAVLWIMREGRYLDAVLGEDCFGSRLEGFQETNSDDTPRLYQRYHPPYKRWRDSGIEKARYVLLKENKSVCILGLDIKEYYYHISINYNEAAREIAAGLRGIELNEIEVWETSDLLRSVERMGSSFKNMVSEDLLITHPGVSTESMGLPIGLLSSQLLANWYLKPLDDSINSEIRPYYYGRYVDDILLVVPAPTEFIDNSPVESILNSLFVKNKLLLDCGQGTYEIASRQGLYLQKDKCLLQHFDVNHSLAGLDKFQKTLEANGSDILAMPVEDSDNSLEDVAYDILYEGSTKKFRNVKGITENRFGLAKYLGDQIMLHLLTDDKFDAKTESGVLKFFRGRNAIEFHDLWERVLSLLLISGNKNGFEKFFESLVQEIEKLSFKDNAIESKLKQSLRSHLIRSRELVFALNSADSQGINSKAFRRANMIRHNLVRFPLINYTNYNGSLISRDISGGLLVSESKLKGSPRYINFDECMLLVMSGKLAREKDLKDAQLGKFRYANKIYKCANGFPHPGIIWSAAAAGSKNVHL
ncbi:MAG: RNA-directed DNA polymerase [Massilia sp.]|uniref:RNA-directed DNA polymerase n=1 Tax=Massilia sp. TaxID=1882437 RepID=UPI002FC8EE1F